MIIIWILCLLTAYFFGSVPFGFLLSKAYAGVDISKTGSKNIGATNVSRELGIRWGIITLILDASKGFLPVIIAKYLFPEFETLPILAGVCAVLGHIFPVFLKFRGGKGVATAIGVYLAIVPFSLLIALVVFIFVVIIWDYISVGSMVFAVAMPLLIFLMEYSKVVVIGSIFITVLIFFKHRENIIRLMKGEENRWRKKSSL